MHKLKVKLTKNNSVPLIITALLILPSFLFMSVLSAPTAHAFPKGMTFPLLGGGNFSDTFYAYRSLGEVHRATDIFAPKGTPIVSAVDGVVSYVGVPQDSYGYSVEIRDSEGFLYLYLHINNDTPGTDDGNGGPMRAYAPDIPQGSKVKKGQLIGYVGDSGNAESTPPHLHFEILDSQGTNKFDYSSDPRINPYPYLKEATVLTGADRDYPVVTANELLPYGNIVSTTASLAVGKVKGGSEQYIVAGAGPHYSPHVTVMDKNGLHIGGFYAYNPAQYSLGVNVATGDVNGDGVDEIIVGTMKGAPHVRVLKLDGTQIGAFYAFSPSFDGGVSVATMDANGDGKAEIVVGAGMGGSPHVRTVGINGNAVGPGFYAYAQSFDGGVNVASGDVTGDAAPEIVTVPGPGGSVHLRIFDKNGGVVNTGYNAYPSLPGYSQGAHAAVGNIVRTAGAQPDKSEIIVAPTGPVAAKTRILKADGTVVSDKYTYENWWEGYLNVAAGDGVSYVSSGTNRRSSIRPGI